MFSAHTHASWSHWAKLIKLKFEDWIIKNFKKATTETGTQCNYTGKTPTKSAMFLGAVDVVLTDWIWVIDSEKPFILH